MTHTARCKMRRALIITLVVLALLIAGTAIYLLATTPKSAQPLRFPLTDARRKLLDRVPQSADAFALLPDAALLRQKLHANAVTSAPLAKWEKEHAVPRGWMIGGADVVLWKHGPQTSYVIPLDGFRALLVRMWLMAYRKIPARWEGSTLIVDEVAPAVSSSSDDIEELLHLASELPEGDALVVQRRRSRGAFPPIGRPSVTSVRIAPEQVLIVSRARTDDLTSMPTVQARFPRGAMLSVTFAKPPRVVGDLNRLLGVKIDELVDEGGSISLYDVDAGLLLPRPKGVIAIPANEQSREAMRNVMRVASLIGDTDDNGRELLISFDRTSLDRYSNDAFVRATWPTTQWALRIDPARLVPILRRISDSMGLRLATPRIHRGARDLRGWIDALEQAESVEAAASAERGVEELRVRVASK